MDFTPLETGLATLLGMILAGIAVRLFLTNKFMTKEECELRRENCADHDKQFCLKLDDLHQDLRDMKKTNKNRFDALFSMVRGIIVHGNMKPEIQEKILNQQNHVSRGTHTGG